MNKMTTLFMMIIIVLSFMLGSTVRSKAQDKSFAGVIPFGTTSDRIGFFDQTSGKIYIYDNNISQCLFIGQMPGLGQTVQVVSKS